MNVECLSKRIERTLEIYDPKKTGIAVGTLALYWAGVNVEVRDVDQLQLPREVIELRGRLFNDRVGGTSDMSGAADYDGAVGEHLSLEPQKHMEDIILSYQAFSAIKDEQHRMDYETAKLLAVVDEESGRMALPLYEALLWKANVGREKDIALVQGVLERPQVRAMLADDELQTLQEVLREHEVGQLPK